jgi:hypothetical protein
LGSSYSAIFYNSPHIVGSSRTNSEDFLFWVFSPECGSEFYLYLSFSWIWEMILNDGHFTGISLWQSLWLDDIWEDVRFWGSKLLKNYYILAACLEKNVFNCNKLAYQILQFCPLLNVNFHYWSSTVFFLAWI